MSAKDWIAHHTEPLSPDAALGALAPLQALRREALRLRDAAVAAQLAETDRRQAQALEMTVQTLGALVREADTGLAALERVVRAAQQLGDVEAQLRAALADNA